MQTMISYLDQRAAFWAEEGRKLAAEDRQDESSLTKVRVNVYGICKTLLQVQKLEKGAVQIARLQSTWEQARAKAEAHGDLNKVLIEGIKLETIGEVLRKLEEAK